MRGGGSDRDKDGRKWRDGEKGESLFAYLLPNEVIIQYNKQASLFVTIYKEIRLTGHSQSDISTSSDVAFTDQNISRDLLVLNTCKKEKSRVNNFVVNLKAFPQQNWTKIQIRNVHRDGGMSKIRL